MSVPSGELQELSQRVYRLEDQHNKIFDRIQEHADEARASNARVHERIDNAVEDITGMNLKLESNSATLTDIKADVAPIAEIGKFISTIRRFILWVAAPVGAAVAVWEAVKFFGVT